MTLLPRTPEPVPLADVAAVLADAIRAASVGGPMAVITVQAIHLAAALEQAGFTVIRPASPSAQLTL